MTRHASRHDEGVARGLVKVVRLVLALALAIVAGACGSVASREDAATAAARQFRMAISNQDGAKACALLAPRTRRDVEQVTKQSCTAGLLDQEIPIGQDPARGSDVYGDQARVAFAGDTVFLARFRAGWRVTAAGCTPRGELPYDCMVKGG